MHGEVTLPNTGTNNPKNSLANDILGAVKASIKAHEDGSYLSQDVNLALNAGSNGQDKESIIQAARAVIPWLSPGQPGETLGATKIDPQYGLGDNVKAAVESVVNSWELSNSR